MNENFDNNMNFSAGGNAEPPENDSKQDFQTNHSAEQMNSSESQQTAYTPHVTPPGGSTYTPPVYGGSQYGQGNNAYNAYNAYNNYPPYGQPKPEASKKPSEKKKRGIIIAAIIVCVIFLLSVVVLVFSIISNGDNTEPPINDDAQMNLVKPSDNQSEKNENGLTASEVYKKVEASSVGVLVYTSNQQQLYTEGTGIIVELNSNREGSYIVTCAHVINVKNPRVMIQLNDGTQYEATVVGYDSKTDIGLLHVSQADLPAAEFASSDSASVGDTVYAIGNPGGTQFFGSFTNGMISAIGRPVDSPVGYEVECIQHTAAINPGNSGGALVNGSGQVIGINSSKIASTEYEGMGFSVPSETVKEIVDELVRNGRVTNRPALGITYMPSSYSRTHSIIIKSNNLPSGSIIIDEISASSDLKNKDIKSGDMIIAVNGNKLETHNVLLDAIENGKVGDTLTLTICRIDANYQISTFDITAKLVEDSAVTSTTEEEETSQSFPFSFGQ